MLSLALMPVGMFGDRPFEKISYEAQFCHTCGVLVPRIYATLYVAQYACYGSWQYLSYYSALILLHFTFTYDTRFVFRVVQIICSFAVK